MRIQNVGIFSMFVMSLLSLISACTYTAPFRHVETIGGLTNTAVVTLSAVEWKAGQRSAFFADTKRVLADLPNHAGLLGYSFRFQLLGPKAWTMTVWRDKVARDHFATSPIHAAAVRNSRLTARNMRFMSVEVAVKSLPMKWSEALRLLEGAPAYE